MTQPFTRRFRVRHYELNAFSQVTDVNLVRYLQEAAIEGSAALGCTPAWYRERGTGWVVRRLAFRYHVPVSYGDEVVVATWISGLRGVRSNREYDLTRASDGVRVARGRAEWVYIDTQTGQPTRCPEDWAAVLPKSWVEEDLGIRLTNPSQTEKSHRYTSRQQVRFHDLDAAWHVNHAVYLHWISQAFFEALSAAGQPPERSRQEGWAALPMGHEIQYFAPALAGDTVEIGSWVCELGEDCMAWMHEVCHTDTRKLLARDYSRVNFVNLEGQPAAVPPAIEDILRGPP